MSVLAGMWDTLVKSCNSEQQYEFGWASLFFLFVTDILLRLFFYLRVAQPCSKQLKLFIRLGRASSVRVLVEGSGTAFQAPAQNILRFQAYRIFGFCLNSLAIEEMELLYDSTSPFAIFFYFDL